MNYSKKILSTFLILSFSAFPISAYAESMPEPNGVDLSSVNVIHQESQVVSNDQLTNILDTAKKAIAEDRGSEFGFARLSEQKTYDYITFDEQHTYFYEEAINQEPQLIVVDKDETNVENLLSSEANSSSSKAAALAASTGFITDGVGGRINVTTTGGIGSYLQGTMSLPANDTSVLSTDRGTHTAFNYGGFEYSSTSANGIGSWAADMGLEYYNNLGASGFEAGWKPVIILKKKLRATTSSDTGWDAYASALDPTDSHNLVQYKNGYKPGLAPTMYWWYNYNGKVRMKIDGYAIANNISGAPLVDSHLVTIIESTGSHNIPSISRWKLLSTVVSNDDSGRNRTTFSSLVVNGTPLASGALSSPQNDHSNVTVNSSTSVTIVVNSSVY